MTREQAKLIVEDICVEEYLHELGAIGMSPNEALAKAYRALLAMAEGVPYDDDDPRVYLKKLADDLKQTRQDLRDLYLLSSGETPIALESFRERLKQKYGWEGEP